MRPVIIFFFFIVRNSTSIFNGNDIFVPYLKTACSRFPTEATLEEGDFLELEYGLEKFDCILLSTFLSSILDLNFQKKVMEKAYALSKPGEIVILYDFIFNNPWNPDVKGISLPFLKKLLLGSKNNFHRITLCPPLARKLEGL